MRPQIKLDLTKEQINQLKSIIKTEKKYRTAQRAQSLLLRCKGISVADISFALNVRTETVYIWIKNYKKGGVDSLYEKDGRGRKSIFKDIPQDEIKELINTKASIPIINANIKDKYDINVSNESVRKFIKKNSVLVSQE
ncbi:MAG: helix-turn-helix domain-containing protein [Campylobacterota bacterium]|nr:helix-turn-helix domain-containing protein [Campylobacterota bacterium]